VHLLPREVTVADTLALDQSKSTTPHPAVEAGSVKPLLLHGMIIVDRFMRKVGGRLGTCPTAAASANARESAMLFTMLAFPLSITDYRLKQT